MTSLSDKVARVKELDASLPPHFAIIFGDHLSIIAQLWGEREQQRAVMVQARELIGLGKNTGSDLYLEKAIASIDKALGE